MHPVLKRQLKRIGLSEDSPPSSIDQWRSLIERIEHAYTEADQDRYTLERSLSISSAEMHTLYESLRQRSESQIARSEQMLRSILESVPHGVIVADEDGKFIYWNAAAEEIGGKLPSHFRPEDWSRGIGIYDTDAVTLVPTEELPMVKAMRGASVDGRELFLKTKNRPTGVWVVVHARPLKDQSGGSRGGVIVFRDVNAEKATEAALARVQGDFRQAIENAPDAVAVVRGDKLLYTNRAFSDCLGFDRSALIGTDFWARVHPQDVARAKDVLASLEPSSAGWFQELRFLQRDGASVTLELSAAQSIQFEGQMAKLILARDVTERKRIHAQLLVSERMASLGTMAAGVAHEINSPLSAVIANVALLLRNIERRRAESKGSSIDPGELVDQLQHTRDAAERVRQIVLDLNTFSRSDEIETPTDLRRVLESSLRIARHEIRHRARVLMDLGDVPPVLGNDARLGQVFLNLLVNAAHAIRDAIEDGRTADHQIQISARQVEDRVAVEIRDTGRGMTPETLKQLFTPFFTTKPAGLGTGLGLSICHRIVTKHGGSISAESELGQGTTFRVTLPAFPQPDTPVLAGSTTPTAPVPSGL